MKKVLMISMITLLAVSGCAKQTAKQQTATTPTPRVVSVPAFAAASVNALGTAKAWSNTEVIIGECTAKYYRPDGTFYLTRQRHAVYPWSDSIRIYAAEPQGTFVWQLSGGIFTLLEGTPQQSAALPITLCDPSIARAIWSMMAMPASLATNADPNAALDKATRVMGIWHNPLQLSGGQTWYQNTDSGIFDIYTLKKVSQPKSIVIARGYDYLTIEKTGIMTPRKIEIFTADSRASDPRRIIELDYHTLKSICF
jgi:hypothetical protein